MRSSNLHASSYKPMTIVVEQFDPCENDISSDIVSRKDVHHYSKLQVRCAGYIACKGFERKDNPIIASQPCAVSP
jgi:hypothetical protein